MGKHGRHIKVVNLWRSVVSKYTVSAKRINSWRGRYRVENICTCDVEIREAHKLTFAT